MFRPAPFFVVILIVASSVSAVFAQDGEKTKKQKKEPDKYVFSVKKSVACTPVQSQDRTGTCWSFATASFIESELLRRGKGKHNLSEMFIVKNIYKEKALNYVLRHGEANYSQGALAHDFLNSAEKYGLVPESIYSGKEDPKAPYDHDEMEAVTKGMLDAVIKRPAPSLKWQPALNGVLDVYMGKTPRSFRYQGQRYTPKQLAQHFDFDADDYISITSYSHHPFYESFVLEIPDNFSNGLFYNLPIDDLVETIDYAIEHGYSVAWEGDISERGFSANRGIAVLPENPGRHDLFVRPGKERKGNQEMRQQTFMNYRTTDDHLMHLTGISTDQNGTKYYMIKNSWGEVGPYKGYVYMSEAYVRLKTVAIILHKEGVPPRLRKK